MPPAISDNWSSAALPTPVSLSKLSGKIFGWVLVAGIFLNSGALLSVPLKVSPVHWYCAVPPTDTLRELSATS